MSLYAVKSADGFAGITVKSTESLATELMVASSEKKKSTTTRKESEMTSENETVADIANEMRSDMKCIRNERFFSVHGFNYVQQLVEVMNKQARNEKV